MKEQNKAVWIGSDDLSNEPDFQKNLQEQEFFELPITEQLSEDKSLDLSANRRDFLKYLGFGLGAATMAASCEIPVKRAIPYVSKPDAIVPGVATYFASSFVKGGDYCPILVKTREGRPIKIEGNSLSNITKGGTSARAQASVLDLYDTNRIQSPVSVKDGRTTKLSWAKLDEALAAKMGGQIRILTNTIMSPTTKKVLAEFTAKYPTTKVVTYDSVSSSAILEANQQSFGIQAIPDYHFDKADVIVSFNADFLGTWISPVEYAAGYAKNRKITDTHHPKMSHHIQVESVMTLTGSNADNRVLVRPSEMGAAIAALYNAIVGGISAPKLNAKAAAGIKRAAEKLKASKGKSLVVSGSNNLGEQILVNAINNALSNYGKTLDFGHVSYQRQGIDKDVQALLKEMQAGRVSTLIVMDGANPVFDLPNAAAFATAMSKVKTKVSFAGLMDETAALCDYVAPSNHYLESWGDVEPKRGMYSLIQPTIAPLFDTRQAEVSLLKWAGSPNLNMDADQPYFDYLQQSWKGNMFGQQDSYAGFQGFWDSILHDGVHEVNIAKEVPAFTGNVSSAASKISKPSNAELEVSLFETVNQGGGQYASNPWLQEMPDPITRTVWGNYLMIPVSWDGGNSWSAFKNLNGEEFKGKADIVEISGKSGEAKSITCVRQFGLAPNTLGVALGYGRSKCGQIGRATGTNIGTYVNDFLSIDANGNTQYYGAINVSNKIATDKEFACVQYHHTMGVKGTDPETNETINVDEKTIATLGSGYQGSLTKRSIIRQTNIKELETFVHDLEHEREHHQKLNSYTLYPGHDKVYEQGHHWGMSIDLNACTGCGACQVACVAENNVPMVGKYEVHRHHEMTWLRIDRYYYGDYENPNVVYQPMMCQHCDNAPCENVCPVAATNHSSEGLNQMAYNRCIGTRYCANNCPYKVRRLNWLDYTTADLFPGNERYLGDEEIPFGADNLTRMVLNPDVTVRSRGVIEKCSFCVQRIQEGKLTAKREQRKLRSGDVKTACQTACPTGAIVFGDMNSESSEVVKRSKSHLNYIVLEEVNTQSSVLYSAKVNNRDEALS